MEEIKEITFVCRVGKYRRIVIPMETAKALNIKHGDRLLVVVKKIGEGGD